MDINLYLEKLNQKMTLKKELEEVEQEIKNLVNLKNLEIGKKLNDIILEVFPAKRLLWGSWKIKHGSLGQYDEIKKIIKYEFNIEHYLINRYVSDFKGQGKVNRKGNYYIKIIINYHLLEDVYTMSLDWHGMYTILRDGTLQEATITMFRNIEKKLEKLKDVKIEELKQYIQGIKEELDNC